MISAARNTGSRKAVPPEPDFWLWYAADGQVHLLGYESAARISNGGHTARWLLNASVSATGEQIYYRYRAEDDIN